MNVMWQRKLIKLFAAAPIAKPFGMTLGYDNQGGSCIELPHNPNLTHPLGGTHGGVIATLLDDAGWFAIAAHHEGVWIVTSQFTTHLLRPVRDVGLSSRGAMMKGGRRLAVAEMTVSTSTGDLVALWIGTYVVLDGIPFGRTADVTESSCRRQDD